MFILDKLISKIKEKNTEFEQMKKLFEEPINRILNGRLTTWRALGLVVLLAWLILCIHTAFALIDTKEIACKELDIWALVGYMWYTVIMMVLGTLPWGMFLVGIIAWRLLQDDEGYKNFKKEYEEWKNR